MRIEPESSVALLGGVCSRLSSALGWNTWAVRAVLLLLLLVEPLWVGLGYLAAALLLRWRGDSTACSWSRPRDWESGWRRDWLQRPESPREGARDTSDPVLRSTELSQRQSRIAELDRRFRDWEKSLDR